MSQLSILFHNPFILGAYTFLIASLFSCYFFRKYYFFAPLYLVAYSLAFMGQIVTYLSILPLALLFISILALKFKLKRFIHLFASLTITIIGIGMLTHMVVGFNNFLILGNQTFGSSTKAMNLYLNFDKLSLGILLLGLLVPVISTKQEWKHTFLISIPYLAFSSFILLSYAVFTNLISLDIKFPTTAIYWIIINLFFVVFPEEIFYRGFLQNEITKNLPNKAAPILSILLTSTLFALIHIIFIQNFYYIIAAFIGSILYGTIYHFSKSIESAVITHFGVNLIHFFLFSYPIKG